MKDSVLCKLLGHIERESEIECDAQFTEVTFFCWRCQKLMKVIPWEEAPVAVRNTLVEIAHRFHYGAT